ncbi:MAG: 50S ribosomal protein L21 [Planctomycetes bacterium]|nr:50S ribosomal protein L21 [Planctomycetota bacterium]
MIAVLEDRNQQYRVAAGDRLLIARVAGAESGQSLQFPHVFLISGGASGSRIGAPYVDGVSVSAKVLRQDVKGPKLVIQKYRRRKNYRRRTGFRARYTEIQIEAIHGA